MPAKQKSSNTIDGFPLQVLPDVPDYRDYEYQPPLIKVESEIIPDRNKLNIRNQGREGSCTGFALAAVIDHLNCHRGNDKPVSPRMLYEMARRFDEWPGQEYVGSSCRGAIRGWYSMGVCGEEDWRYDVDDVGHLTVQAAKRARQNRVGAYYRLKRKLADFHTAINETGSIFVSAFIHEGWNKENAGKEGIIKMPDKTEADSARLRLGHAFAIVGYNTDGFWVQNSWGKEWGNDGLALWSYEDWYNNIYDAWAFRLSLSSPAIWQISTRNTAGPAQTAGKSGSGSVLRSEIAGHYVHVDDGKFCDHGNFWSNADDVRETVNLVTADDSKYDHLLFYAHGGLNTPKKSAARVRAMKPVFKANGIYPFHFMYDTGLAEELKDVIFRNSGVVKERAGVSVFTDFLLEKTLRIPGRAMWREMKSGAFLPFEESMAGWQTLKLFTDGILRRQAAGRPMKIHLLGHSMGAILHAYLLAALERVAPSMRVASVTLMAPSASESLFKSHYHPLLDAEKRFAGIDRMTVLNLNDRLEKDDQVANIYRKSMLYLISNSFEEQPNMPLLGMQKYSTGLDRRVGKLVDFHYSDGSVNSDSRTTAKTHGGFDNDPTSMNFALRNILKGSGVPKVLFTKQDLDY